MIKIVILADTHGNTKDIQKLVPILSESDIILFAGDGLKDLNILPPDIYKKVRAVKGNCDLLSADREVIFDVSGKKILLTHGDMYGVKSGLTKLCLHAREVKADIVIFGHTHFAEVLTFDKTMFINPGTLSRYAEKKTFAYLVIANGKPTCVINESFF